MHRHLITNLGNSIGENIEYLLHIGAISSVDEGSGTSVLWRDILKKRNMATEETDLDVKDLFCMLNHVFNIEYRTNKTVKCLNGYVYDANGKVSIPHNNASRVYAAEHYVYVDELLVSVLFEYAATYYIWALEPNNEETYGFCFKNTLYLLDHCCRKGNLNSDLGKMKILEHLDAKCDASALNLISDLYWCMMAFAICHELSHIYLGHMDVDVKENRELQWRMEYEADRAGYDIFLKLICGRFSEIRSPFTEIFHDYLYAAPMILYLFYGDLFYMGYWLYGETVGDSHPKFQDRIEKLLIQSENDDYVFDNIEGNAVLSEYWNRSNLFREELFYKLKNGKLEEIKRKGANTTMRGNGYEEAVAYNSTMCAVMRALAQDEGVSPDKMVGLWDIAVQVDVVGDQDMMPLVWSVNGTSYSTKAVNVYFRLKTVLESIIEIGLTLTVPNDTFNTIRLALLILLKLLQSITVELTPEMSRLLMECHKRNAYVSGVEKEELLNKAEASDDTLDTLCSMSCIRLQDNKVFLEERILINR